MRNPIDQTAKFDRVVLPIRPGQIGIGRDRWFLDPETGEYVFISGEELPTVTAIPEVTPFTPGYIVRVF